MAAGESPETALDCGLIKGHAYCITDVRKVINQERVCEFSITLINIFSYNIIILTSKNS